MELCPKCGSLFTRQQPRGAFSNTDLYHPEDLLLMGCLCYYDYLSLERTFISFEERFNEILSERFPGKKRSEIYVEIGKMERHSPLRVSLAKKMEVHKRVKSRLEELRKLKEKEEEKEGEKEEQRERLISGESLSLHDWMVEFTK